MVGSGGTSLGWGGANSGYFLRDPGLEPLVATWSVYVQRTGTIGSYARPLAKTYNNGTASPYSSYDFEWNPAGDGQDSFTANVCASLGLTGSPVYTFPEAGVPEIVIGSDDGANLRVYVAGVEVSTTAVTSTLQYDTTSTGDLIVSGSSNSSPANEWNGLIYLAVVWGRVLTPTEIESFSRNPWRLFWRRRRAYSLITGSTISASISEAVTSADAYAISATATATITTAATSADAYALAATVPSAISEAISAASSDSYTTSATIFATLTETIAPSDAYAIAVAVAAALDSSAAASSALTAVATIAATIAEVSTAQDTLGVTATVLAAIAEAATATDTQATGSVTSAAYADSATAAAIFNATVSIAATLTEAGLAADQIAAMATVAADLAESGAAADAYLSSVLLAVELLENAAAADELSATAFEQIIDAAKTIITIVQARDTVTLVQAQDTVTMVQARDTLRILQ